MRKLGFGIDEASRDQVNFKKVLKEEGVWLEITCLLIPEWTDDLDMVKRMCEWLAANGLGDCPVHFTRFMPLYKLTQLPLTPVATLEQAREIAGNVEKILAIELFAAAQGIDFHAGSTAPIG